MFNFKKKKSKDVSKEAEETEESVVDVELDTPTPQKSWFKRLSNGLSRTRSQLGEGFSHLVLGKKVIDDELFEELETLLLVADVGINTTDLIMDEVRNRLSRKALKDPELLLAELKATMVDMLSPYCQPLAITKQPFSILMVGINGAGKTTSTAKIAHYYKEQGLSKILLAAGDTFRAAAIEQLQTWGERNQIPVISQHLGADSASVIYDAMQSAIAKKTDVVIADTAGRLHTQSHLMEELKKVKRVMSKLEDTAPDEVLLVLDASLGQNAIQQCQEFNDAIGVTGLCLTKLDGTAKGGIIFALANTFKIPIRFIGVGEAKDDLKPFNAVDFVEAIFAKQE